MIDLNNVSFAYKEKPVFENLSLRLENGSKTCFFAESGKGKTTLLRIITGLEKPQSGTVDTYGEVFSAVFQENRLLPFKTVLNNITLIGAARDTALYHLTALGLGNAASKYPSELSGGMLRRAALARALSAEYTALILDEPFSGLDSGNIKTAAEHILKSAGDRTVIAVTHSEYEAEALGAKIIRI